MPQHGTGGVVNGVFVGLPQLTPAGWNPYVGLPMVMSWVRDCLRDHGARVALETDAFASVQAFSATRRMLHSRPRAAVAHPSRFSRSYTAYSGSFAEFVMHCPVKCEWG